MTSRGYQIQLAFLLFICVMSTEFLDEPEELRRVEKTVFLTNRGKLALIQQALLRAWFSGPWGIQELNTGLTF